VKQATLPRAGSHLLDHAISRLSPEVFSHPVWMRFSEKIASDSVGIVDDLLSAVQNLEEDDQGSACQLLLICAFFQSRAGQHFHALGTTRQAISLAKHASLAREAIWAMWGACAVSLQHGDYRQAAGLFVDLQAALHQQNEWILADLIDVLRQSLSESVAVRDEKPSGPPYDQPFGDLLSCAHYWLQHWGFADQVFDSELTGTSQSRINHSTRSFFFIHPWRCLWQSLIRAFRDELRLHGAKHDASPPKRQVSLWGSILNALRLWLSDRSPDTEVGARALQLPDVLIVSSMKERPPKPTTYKKTKTQKSTVSKVHGSQQGKQAGAMVPVAVHMLGTFSMTIGDLPVKLPASRGFSVLKFLLLHHKQYTSREVLMETFWPEAEPETARNCLNVALYSLRKALRSVTFLPLVIFEDGAYRLEPSLQIWLDVEEFESRVSAGQRLEMGNQLTAAIAEYEAAISLCQGDLLEQNPYEEWTVLDRERLRIAYLEILDRLSQIYFSQERYAACITVCQLMLRRDRCREDAHCLLMRCYSLQGQYHLALRQYQLCVEALDIELDVEPAEETTKLYEQIRHREIV
jgi:DNA-binding SARP family transcriptional activator